MLRHDGRIAKDARADDPADGDQREIEDAESAAK
jgi:hypothetical protein